MTRKRNYPVTIWLDEKELVLLKDKVSKTYFCRSYYIRKCSLGKDIIVVPGIRDLMIDLRKISNYLGQITCKVNNGDVVVLGDNLKEIKESLKNIWADLSRVVKKI